MIMMGFGSLSIYLLNSVLPLSWVLIIEATMIFFTARKELVWLSIFKGFNRSLVNANVDKLTLNSVRLCYWGKKIYCISLRTKRFATSFISEMVRRINSTVRNRKQNKMLGSDLVRGKVKSLKSKQLKDLVDGKNWCFMSYFCNKRKKIKIEIEHYFLVRTARDLVPHALSTITILNSCRRVLWRKSSVTYGLRGVCPSCRWGSVAEDEIQF